MTDNTQNRILRVTRWLVYLIMGLVAFVGVALAGVSVILPFYWSEAVKELLTNFVCVIVDGDVETAAGQKLGASGYPHIVFVSAKGDKLAENSGYAPAAEFKAVVQKALDKSRDKS